MVLPILRITFESEGIQDYLSPEHPSLVLQQLFVFVVVWFSEPFCSLRGTSQGEKYCIDPTVHIVSLSMCLRAVLEESRREAALLISVPSIPSKEETN